MTSKIFFPLRTSVELFKDANNPTAVTRAKQAAVLYDELIFEEGLYEVTTTPNGSQGDWTPPEQITLEVLENAREIPEAGATMSVLVGVGENPDHEQMLEIFSGKITDYHMSEFYTGILEDLKQFKPDWVKTVLLPNTPPSSNPVGKAIRELGSYDSKDKNFLPELREQDLFRQKFIYKSFNRDSVLATHMGAVFNVTGLFAPMIERRGGTIDHLGSEALDIVVPHLGSLPWEAVIEFRDHRGSREARAKLREFEELAAREESEDALRFHKRVSQEVNNATMSAWNDVRPNLPEELAKEATSIVVSLTQVIGPFTPLINIGKAIRDSLQNRHSWTAALWNLKNRL